MHPIRAKRRSRAIVCALLAATIIPPIPARGGDWFGRVKAKWQNHKDVPSAEALAYEIKCLEKHLDWYGSIVAKHPDVWGQARLMKYRQEFEQVLADELKEFKPSLQASISRTDQAFLASAFSLSAAISGSPAALLPPSTSSSREVVVEKVAPAATAKEPTVGAEGQPEDEDGSTIKIPNSNPAASLVPGVDQEVLKRRDISTLKTGVAFEKDAEISLEPTEFLDQMARYVQHLHEIRRVSEGDDTVDSPGYALHLVRIPVSILPGSKTRKGYGAEITVTASPVLGRDLLPTTFRNLVINDLVEQVSAPLTAFFNSKTSVSGFMKMRNDLSVRDADGKNRGVGNAAKTISTVYQEKGAEQFVQGLTAFQVPASRGRNARFAFPATQISEVYGWELVTPVALQAFDVLLQGRMEDDPEQQVVMQYHLVANYVEDQVAAAYELLERPENEGLWLAHATPELAAAIQGRDREALKLARKAFLDSLANAGKEDASTHKYGDQYTSTAAFAWAIMVESVLLNERLIQDIREAASAKGAPIPMADSLPFFLPCPPDEAREAFHQYVRIRFPIHVFALDPLNQEQNLADQLSRARETQLALSLAFVTGNISAGTMTRFARRLELQAETIALNRTQIAFSHGDDTFGWRFQPRYQTPPTQGNMTVAFRDLLAGGPTREQDRRQLELEPGPRECVALVIMPSFVPYASFETRTNWYRLNSPKHSEIDPLKFLELSKSIKRAYMLAQALCTSDLYRDGDIARLVGRVKQLSAELPFQSMTAQVPYENTQGGFELFNVGITDLAPELRSWYGSPGVDPKDETTLFLVGDNFSVHQTSVVVGNKFLKAENVDLLSRQVMRVTVPAGAQAVVRGGRPFVEASIATPYGVSQSLLIPTYSEEPEKPKEVIPKVPIFTWATPKLKLGYRFDGVGIADPIKATESNRRRPNTLVIGLDSGVDLVGTKADLTLSFDAPDDKVRSVELSDVEYNKDVGGFLLNLDQVKELAGQLFDQRRFGKVFGKANPPRDVIVGRTTLRLKGAPTVPMEVNDTLTIQWEEVE